MTKNLSFRILSASLLCMLIAVGQIFGQVQAGSGQITGVVTDSNGAVVPNATVTLTSKATNETKTTNTGGDGIYRFILLRPGDYSIKISAASFADLTLEAVVQVGRVTDANATLGAGDVNAVVEVTAENIQTTVNNFDAVQNETAIQNLPINGRRFQDFVTLTPTAQVDPSRGQISLSGQRGINSNVNVDGVDYNQPFFGGIRGGERSNSAFTLPQEAIREFQVVAAGYSAEFGRSSGGIVNAVTKSGTNDVRGSLFYVIRPEQLARGNKFSDALADQRLNALGVDATLAPTQHQFGGSIGGPFVKNKLFYFASYEQQRFRAPRQVLFQNLVGFSAPTTSQTEAYNFYRSNEVQYQSTNDAYGAFGKIDWNLNDANRLAVRYNFSANKARNGVSTGETALDPTTTNSLPTNGTEEDKNHIVVGQFISTISANVINEFRGQFAREERPRTPNDLIAAVNTSIGNYGTRNFLPTTQYDKRIQFGDALTILHASHSFKFGGEFSDLFVSQLFGFNQLGVYTFSGLTSTTGILDALGTTRTATYRGRFDTTTARYNQQIGNLMASYRVKELSFFGQDSWRVNRRVTINYGLRFEKQYNPSAEANNTPVLNLVRNTVWPLLGHTLDPTQIPNSQNEWGPRLGIAIDPLGNGKTVIRAYAGEYYARTPLLVLAAPFNNFRDPAGDLSVTLGSPAFSATGFNQATFDANNPQYVSIVGGTGFTPNTVYRQFAILGINLNSQSLSSLPTLTPTQVGQIQTAILNATTNPPANLGAFQGANFIGISPEFKNPQSFQWGVGFEHQVLRGLTVGLDFSYVNTIHLQRNRDINLPNPTGVDPVTGRVLVNRASRPLTSIGTLQIRDSSARSLYRALTARVSYYRSWVRVNAFYTNSRSLSDDDNERDSGGVLYDNPYDLTGEYYNSRLNRRHQFVANPVFFLPYKFEISSAIRARSGVPVNSLVGTDLNGDGNNNERPFILPGYELPRNYFSNRRIIDIDLRVQKRIGFGEHRSLVLSTEFFNILNMSNSQFSGSSTTNYCSSASATCGLAGVTNINFLNLYQQTPTASNFGKLNLSGLNPGSQVFQMQLGARFYF